MTDLAPLTRAEQVALDDCEQRIERGLKTFIEVGAALSAIRDNRLYRTTHQTFEAYAVERWSLSRAHAYRMIAAADVVSPIGDTGLPMPANEGQVRELARVPESDRADVWAEAVERTAGKPTAAAVRQVAEERAAPPFDLKAKIRADLAEIGVEGMPVGGIRLGLPQDIPGGDVDTAIGELVDAGEVLCVGTTPMGATLWALTELVGAEDHPETGEGGSAGLPSAAATAGESDASVVGDVAADELPARACEACGGPVDQDAIAAGFLRCEACDEDGDHVDRDGVCMGCNPPSDEPEQPARSPMFTPEQRRQIEADAERDRSIRHARKIADRLVSEVSGLITEIVSGVQYGATGLITAEMVAGLHAQADRLEKWMGESQ